MTVAFTFLAPAQAQDSPATDPQFSALSARLRTGDTVTVTDTAGEAIEGRLIAVTPHALTVGRERRTIEAARVDRVRRTRRGVMLGAIIGGGAGAAASAALASLAANEGGNETAAFCDAAHDRVGGWDWSRRHPQPASHRLQAQTTQRR